MAEWDGVERRKDILMRGFCSAHIPMITDFAEIKTSVKNIEKQLTESSAFRNGVVISLISMGLIIVIQIASFAYLFGTATKQIEVNTGRLNVLEEQHRIK